MCLLASWPHSAPGGGRVPEQCPMCTLQARGIDWSPRLVFHEGTWNQSTPFCATPLLMSNPPSFRASHNQPTHDTRPPPAPSGAGVSTPPFSRYRSGSPRYLHSLLSPSKRRPEDTATKLAKHHCTLRGRAAHRVCILGGASEEVWHDFADAAPRSV